MNPRTATISRKTSETEVIASVNLDGSGTAQIATGLGFLDHMLTALARHSGVDVAITCNGDLHIDDHHTAEDCALTLGAAIDAALGERRAFARFGSAYAPMDESLARAVIDFSGRPAPVINLGLKRESIGAIATENVTHVFVSLAASMRSSIHLDVLRGSNDHHRAEAAFKALALALKQALARTQSLEPPSTKGLL